jgi:hypothetical protein
MGGKALAAIGGILSLAGCFALSWIDQGISNSFYYVIPAILKMADYFTNAAGTMTALNTATGLTLDDYFSYILGIGVLLVALSGIFGLIGVKVRALSIIGGLFSLIPGVFILLSTFLDVAFVQSASEVIMYLFQSPDQLVDGIIPFSYAIAGRNEAIGTYVLILGGLLSLISGFISREDY